MLINIKQIPRIMHSSFPSQAKLCTKMADSSELKPSQHIALLPSSGMGHLMPFLRLAALLTEHHVKVTFITPYPAVSIAESQTLSRFFSTFPQISRAKLHLVPFENLSANSEDDPFHQHNKVIRESCHLLLSSLLPSLSSPPLSALVTDMTLTVPVLPISRALNIPTYIFFSSSAKMLTLLIVSFHTHTSVGSNDAIEMPTLEPIPKSWIPPPLFQAINNPLKTSFIETGKKMMESAGILVNTSETIEGKTLAALNGGKVIEGLPLVIPIGLLPAYGFEKSQPLAWLDDQATGSVVYVSFGSKTAMSREQLRELGDGLVRSGYRFLWVVKDKKVDREDDEELPDVIGHELMESVNGKGLVVKHWLDQESILRHPAVGGSLTHGGWNSVTEAMWNGVRVLAWPQDGDQKINADVLERIGMGMWVQSWGWGGEAIINREQIAENIREMMGNELPRIQAMRIREEARTAIEQGGSLKKRLTELIEMWKI